MIIEKLIRYQRGAHPLEVLRVVREASDVIRIEVCMESPKYAPTLL